MLLLDCESEATALKSTAAILGVAESRLSGFLLGIPLDEYWEGEAHETMPSDEFILERVREIRKIDGLEHVDGTCFFHMTRAFSKKDFEAGLLPLPAIADRIWERLYALVSDEVESAVWSDFRQEFESTSDCRWAYLYRMKMKDADQNGPFGALVRQSCLKLKETTPEKARSSS